MVAFGVFRGLEAGAFFDVFSEESGLAVDILRLDRRGSSTSSISFAFRLGIFSRSINLVPFERTVESVVDTFQH